MSIVTIDINCYNLCPRVFYLFFFPRDYGFILYLNLNDFDLTFVYGLRVCLTALLKYNSGTTNLHVKCVV